MAGPYHYVIGDEAGETGFKFNRGSSMHFVVGLVMTNEVGALAAQVIQFRRLKRLQHTTELKFHSSPDANRLAFLKDLMPIEWAFRALVVDKRTLVGERRMRLLDFYIHFVAQALRWASSICSEAIVILDEFVTPAQTVPTLTRRLRSEVGIGPGFPFKQPPKAVRSEGEPLVYVADMLTGSVLRLVEDGDPRFHRVIRPRALIWRWGENENPPR